MDARSAMVSKDVARSPEESFSQKAFGEGITSLALDLTNVNFKILHPINRENTERAKSDPAFVEVAKPAYVNGGRYQALTESLVQFHQGDVLRLTQMHAAENIENRHDPNYRSSDRGKFLAGQVEDIKPGEFGRVLDRIRGRYITASLELDNRDKLNPLTAASLQGRVEGYGQVLATMGGTDYLQEADDLVSEQRKRRNKEELSTEKSDVVSEEKSGSGLPRVELPKGIELPTELTTSVQIPDNFKEGILKITQMFKGKMIGSRFVAEKMNLDSANLPFQYKLMAYPTEIHRLVLESWGQSNVVNLIDDFIAGRVESVEVDDLSEIINVPTIEEFRIGTLEALKVNGALALERWNADQNLRDSSEAERSKFNMELHGLNTAVKEMEKIYTDIFPELSEAYNAAGEVSNRVIMQAARARGGA